MLKNQWNRNRKAGDRLEENIYPNVPDKGLVSNIAISLETDKISYLIFKKKNLQRFEQHQKYIYSRSKWYPTPLILEISKL